MNLQFCNVNSLFFEQTLRVYRLNQVAVPARKNLTSSFKLDTCKTEVNGAPEEFCAPTRCAAKAAKLCGNPPAANES